MADEAAHHKECLIRFMLNWPSFEAKNKPKGRSVDENMLQSSEMLWIWLDVEADAKLYTVTELHNKMTEVANGEAVYSIKWVKTKLKEKYKDSLYFPEINGRSDVVCFSNMVNYIVNDKWYESRKSDKTKEAERIVIAAAKIIMAEIREMNYDNLVYLTHDDIVLPEKQDSFLPSSLHKFLQVLIRPKIKQNSIGQTTIYSTRLRSVIPPIPFGVGIEMDHIFGSKWLINELLQLGFSISYDEVNRYKQSVIENNNIIDMQNDLPEVAFDQCSVDNVDHSTCTIDGKKTFHGIGIISMATHKNDINLIWNRAIKRLASQKK